MREDRDEAEKEIWSRQIFKTVQKWKELNTLENKNVHIFTD